MAYNWEQTLAQGRLVVAKHYGPGPHKSGLAQDVHGSGGGKAEFEEPGEATNLSRQLKESGGFTYQLVSNQSPSDGYMVSPYKDREMVVDADRLSARTLSRYMRQNADLLTRGDHYLGGWLDEGKVYLDISVRKRRRADATALAKQHKQLAFFDLKKLETVYV